MSIERVLLTQSYPAAADLTAEQYKVVCLGADGTVNLPKTAITAVPLGILQNAPDTGEEAVVALIGSGGISKAVANAALANGAVVALEWVSDSDSGKVKAAASTQYPIGQVVFPSGAEDDLCSVLLTPMTVKA
jgi:hypothetical protein